MIIREDRCSLSRSLGRESLGLERRTALKRSSIEDVICTASWYLCPQDPNPDRRLKYHWEEFCCTAPAYGNLQVCRHLYAHLGIL